EILRARPERIALMASGGMSHFPGTDRYASPEFEYDGRLLESLKAGRGRELAAITGEELDKMGNIELRTWATVLGAVGDAKADVYCYEPSWHHGNAVVEWPVGDMRGARSASGGEHVDGRAASPSLPAGVGLPAQPLSLRAQVRRRLPRAVSKGRARGDERAGPRRRGCRRAAPRRSGRAPGSRGAPVSRVHGGPSLADGARADRVRVFLRSASGRRLEFLLPLPPLPLQPPIRSR